MSGLHDLLDTSDAVGLADAVRRGEVTPAEVLEATLDRIAERNPTLNAVTTSIPADPPPPPGSPDAGNPGRSPGSDSTPRLYGVPFAIKDLHFAVQGTISTHGSRLFADAPPADHDAELVRRYRAAGMVIVGRTNSPELGLSTSTEPALLGPCANPLDPTRSAGGSSGGAAAAVTSGMLPVAHASDGGGSIRIPASACGLFGLKPSRGRITFAPDAGEGWSGYTCSHVVSRSVRDSAVLLDITAGPAAGDPYSAPPPPHGSFEQAISPQAVAGLGRLRIAVWDGSADGIALDDTARGALDAAVALCEELGHEIVEADLPVRRGMGGPQGVIVAANIAAIVRRRAAQLDRPPEEPVLPGELEPVAASMLIRSQQMSAADYADAILQTHLMGRRMGEYYEQQDIAAVLTPTLAAAPPPLGELVVTADAGTDALAEWGARQGAYSPFTATANATGQPAMSVPLHADDRGLTVGSHFVGRYGDEATLLTLAAQLEQARPFWDKPPAG